MSSEELAALADLPPSCPHGMADSTACEECAAPAAPVRDWTATRMRLPQHLATATLDNWEPECPGAVRAFCGAWPPSPAFLWLGGRIGTGKSHLAVGIIREVHAMHGVTGQFWPVSEVVDSYRAAASPEYEGPWPTAALDTALMKAPLLVLDDMGAEYGTAFAAAKLFAVVDARYRGGLATVVTTNVGADAIDARLRSRLLSGQEVRFTGKDRRQM